MSTTYAVHIDYKNQTVSIRRDHRAVHEKDKAQALARLWAEHYGFELREEPED